AATHDEDACACDLCQARLPPELLPFFEVSGPVIPSPTFTLRTDTRHATTTPGDIVHWNYPSEDDFLVEANAFQAQEIRRALSLLSRLGLCIIRISGADSDEQLLRSVIRAVGEPTRTQNDFDGRIKDLKPGAHGAPGTG